MRVVQVPMDEAEAAELAKVAKSLRISRADFIRKACSKYLQALRDAQLDEEYERGYRETPEDPTTAATLATLVSIEDW